MGPFCEFIETNSALISAKVFQHALHKAKSVPLKPRPETRDPGPETQEKLLLVAGIRSVGHEFPLFAWLMILEDLFVALELALHLVYGFFDRRE